MMAKLAAAWDVDGSRQKISRPVLRDSKIGQGVDINEADTNSLECTPSPFGIIVTDKTLPW